MEKIYLAAIPLILIQLSLIIICILDWRKRHYFKHLNKIGWIVIILFVNIIGPILYLTIGRDNDQD